MRIRFNQKWGHKRGHATSILPHQRLQIQITCKQRLRAVFSACRCCIILTMVYGGQATDRVDEDTKKIDLRYTTRLSIHAGAAFWFLGLILLLPMSWGWYSRIPIEFFMAFPYAVDFASDTWVDRIIATTILGLFCWLISGILHVVSLYRRKSRRVLKWSNVVAKVLLISVTLLVLVHSMAGILFLSIDCSNIPL